MTAQASHNIYSTVDVYFVSIIIVFTATLTKSSGEPYDIVKDTSDTFGLAKQKVLIANAKDEKKTICLQTHFCLFY
jgi:hypothetical protein